jgi:hypothetical protein
MLPSRKEKIEIPKAPQPQQPVKDPKAEVLGFRKTNGLVLIR